MDYRYMGKTGLKVSELCLGAMTFGRETKEEDSRQILDRFVAAGGNFIDTADVYTRGASEQIVGRWLKDQPRDDLVIATKVRFPMGSGPNEVGLSRKHILAGIEASLRRLQTDYIDLYQVHSPDPTTSIEETLRALDDLVHAGKVRYIGCSNYLAWQLAEALWTSDKHNLARFECAQPRYNILFRMIEDEILPLCRSYGVGVIVYNPLAGGMLTGRYREKQEYDANQRFGLKNSGELYRKRYWKGAVFEEVNRLGNFFEAHGKSLAHVALAWVLAQPGITCAILGASKPEQLQDSLKGVDLPLDDEELQTCDQAWYNLPRERDPSITQR
jgi:aryl-alcohol dehydrogenase-like predicted oxidoreductase